MNDVTKVSIRRRLIPQPLLSVILWSLWLLLNQSLAAGHIVLGAVIAWLIPILLRPMAEPNPPLKRPFLALRYFFRLLLDIVLSNIQVARQVLGPIKKLQPGFVAYPLKLHSDLPITILSSTIALTPGTLTAEVSEDRKCLYIHVLDLQDEQALIDSIRSRYEDWLKEMFE
ncbi:MAG: Na+/H+ antiporter subunit E [Hahellaceae bacterium]|nr:Na+/H+ antiporter subunit E [Hahellaceae bacterium]